MAAGVIMSALMLASGRGLPKPRLWGPLALLGLLMNVVGNGFVVYAQQFVASGLTAVLIATDAVLVGVDRAAAAERRSASRSDRSRAWSLVLSGIFVLVWPELTQRRRERPGVRDRRDRDSAGVRRLGDRHLVPRDVMSSATTRSDPRHCR
jgi:hypothetical protein